jgi:hypothetical protein
MRKFFFSLFFFFIITFIVSDPILQDNNQIEKLATPILENILLGIEKQDYKMYSKDFDESMKKASPESKFKDDREQIISRVGLINEKTYLGFLNKEYYTLILWKGKSDKSDDDLLIQLACSKQNDKIFIIGLWFK